MGCWNCCHRTIKAVKDSTSIVPSERQFCFKSCIWLRLIYLVGGKRLLLSKPLPSADYYALVSRAEKRPNCEVYHWKFCAIPCRRSRFRCAAPDADIRIDLGKVFRETFERGRYARSLS